MPETEQFLRSTNSYYDVASNEDGSIGIIFGPEQPEGVADTNFIQTVPGRYFMAILQLYGAELPFYDQTRRPDDLVKVDGLSRPLASLTSSYPASRPNTDYRNRPSRR